MDIFNFKQAKESGYDFAVEVITESGEYDYPNLQMAQAAFKTLDPNENTRDFTWGMYGGFSQKYQKHLMRFEDWPTEKALSI